MARKTKTPEVKVLVVIDGTVRGSLNVTGYNLDKFLARGEVAKEVLDLIESSKKFDESEKFAQKFNEAMDLDAKNEKEALKQVRKEWKQFCKDNPKDKCSFEEFLAEYEVEDIVPCGALDCHGRL